MRPCARTKPGLGCSWLRCTPSVRRRWHLGSEVALSPLYVIALAAGPLAHALGCPRLACSWLWRSPAVPLSPSVDAAWTDGHKVIANEPNVGSTCHTPSPGLLNLWPRAAPQYSAGLPAPTWTDGHKVIANEPNVGSTCHTPSPGLLNLWPRAAPQYSAGLPAPAPCPNQPPGRTDGLTVITRSSA